MNETILVTGSAGFIGSNFVHTWFETEKGAVVNLDKLTYAGNPANLQEFEDDARYSFVQGDIGDRKLVDNLLAKHRPRAIVNFAAESHVDRSIHGPAEFIQSNIVGTFNMLESARSYWSSLDKDDRNNFRLLHVSTDEVYGTLSPTDAPFTEMSTYQPNSPYAASKAASDHLVRSWHHTYGLPVVTTNCSNNYGPFHFPEKLIPLVILNALGGKPLPIYGDGKQIRDWLYVKDHCRAIIATLDKGEVGETYNIGGWNEKTNLEVVLTICEILDELKPLEADEHYADLIEYVTDRPGHDRRYAIDARKIERELGWTPKETFDSGIRKTVDWYLANAKWVEGVISGEYRNWMRRQYGE